MIKFLTICSEIDILHLQESDRRNSVGVIMKNVVYALKKIDHVT